MFGNNSRFFRVVFRFPERSRASCQDELDKQHSHFQNDLNRGRLKSGVKDLSCKPGRRTGVAQRCRTVVPEFDVNQRRKKKECIDFDTLFFYM